MNIEIFAPYQQHLEYLGYTVEENNEESFMAIHPTRTNFILAYRYGIVLYAFYNSTEAANEDHSGLLHFVNGLNSKSLTTRFFADDDNSITAHAWFPEKYDRIAFGGFMDLWQEDTGPLLRMFPDEVDRYLV